VAKRWMVQKRLKMKRFRAKARGHMKKYSAEQMSGGSTPNPEVMSWYKNAANSLSNGSIPQREMMHYNSNIPRKEALALRDKIIDACPEWMYFRLVDDGWLRARMYFAHNPERCCVVALDKRTKHHRRSIVYKNRDVAYQRWCESTVDWVEPSDFYHPNIPETFPPED